MMMAKIHGKIVAFQITSLNFNSIITNYMILDSKIANINLYTMATFLNSSVIIRVRAPICELIIA